MSRILIVDDVEENLYLLHAILVKKGHVIEQAHNGSEALVKALSNMPDLIISDILMPVIDGFTLCRIWKTDQRLSRIPFIFYTATYKDSRDKKLAIDMGVDAFIIKPSEPDDFIRTVDSILELCSRGNPDYPRKPGTSDEAILKNYNEVLIRKLEDKMRTLEQANVGLQAEISARRQAEQQIMSALREKDALLKEIHHRVKNNMQVISSLINLQLHSNLKKMPPNEVTDISVELQNRIQSMAIVHEMLYQSKNLAKIDIREYINNLLRSLFGAFNINFMLISLVMEISDTPVNISTAVPLGLIINELLTNILKYSFPDGRGGEIRIAMDCDAEGMYHLTIRDNGSGLPGDFNIDSTESFGLRLVTILLKQLKGTIECRNDNGAVFSIHFPNNESGESFALTVGPA